MEAGLSPACPSAMVNAGSPGLERSPVEALSPACGGWYKVLPISFNSEVWSLIEGVDVNV